VGRGARRRSRRNLLLLREGMLRLGFRAYLPEQINAPVIATFHPLSASFDLEAFHDRLLCRGFAIYPGKLMAGLSNQIADKCNYRDSEDRIAFLDSVREKLIIRRSAAVEEFFQSFRARPPYVYTSEDVEVLGVSERRKLEQRLLRRCHAGTLAAGHLRKLDDLPFGWVLPRSNTLPARFADPEFSLRIGSSTSHEIRQEYQRHVPVSSLLDDATIKALQM
jgi:hypothetical protein